jgi:hypothetical protein
MSRSHGSGAKKNKPAPHNAHAPSSVVGYPWINILDGPLMGLVTTKLRNTVSALFGKAAADIIKRKGKVRP